MKLEDVLQLFVVIGEDLRAALSDTLLAVESIGRDDAAEAFPLLERADRQFARDGDAWCWGSNAGCRLGRCGLEESTVALRVAVPGRAVEVAGSLVSE